jgi:hypothetical protein
MLFLDFFCGGIVSCSSAETRWAPMLGVSENPDKIPEHERENSKHVQSQWWRKRRLRISCRLHKFPKFWIPLHVPSRPPFTGRRRDFYIPTIPLNSKNIPSVNTHKCLLHLIHLQACH